MPLLELTPELATLVDAPPSGPGWFHEAKLDGYRVLAQLASRRAPPKDSKRASVRMRQGSARVEVRPRAREQKKVTLWTRGGNDWTSRAPAVADALLTLPAREAVLDGEMVMLRKDGVSDFQALQNALRTGNQAALCFFAFDLLWLDGRDLRDLPLRERKRLLATLLRRGKANAQLRYVDHVEVEGPKVFAKACKLGLEGIVSKRADSRYEGRRTMAWRKSKCSARQELVIGGFTAPAGTRKHLGALLMGVHENGALRYAGKVGTGFNERSLSELAGKLGPLERASSPFADSLTRAEQRGVHWVQPRLVAEIEFTEFTQDHRMRHPSFLGLREDKTAVEVVQETPAKGRKRRTLRATEATGGR